MREIAVCVQIMASVALSGFLKILALFLVFVYSFILCGSVSVLTEYEKKENVKGEVRETGLPFVGSQQVVCVYLCVCLCGQGFKVSTQVKKT